MCFAWGRGGSGGCQPSAVPGERTWGGGEEGRTEPRGPGAQRAPPRPWNRSSPAPLSARREKRGQRGGPKQRRHRFCKALGMPSAEGTAAERHGVQELLPAPLCRSVTACLTGLTAGSAAVLPTPAEGEMSRKKEGNGLKGLRAPQQHCPAPAHSSAGMGKAVGLQCVGFTYRKGSRPRKPGKSGAGRHRYKGDRPETVNSSGFTQQVTFLKLVATGAESGEWALQG